MRRFLTLCIVLTSVASFAQPAPNNKSIFDDDWEPPKRRTPAGEPGVKEAPPAEPKPAEPSSTESKPELKPKPSETPAKSGPAARRAVPSAAEQAPVRAALKEVYADQLNDRSPAASLKLAKVLLDHAGKSANEAPIDQFVLLTAAMQAGLDASSLPIAFTAADHLAAAFEVSAMDLKVDAMGRFKSTVPANVTDNVRAAIGLSAELAADHDVLTAIEICKLAQTPGLDAESKAQLAFQFARLNAAKGRYEQIERDRNRLKVMPDDPVANLSVGRFECFVRGDWGAGLPYLAKGGDPAMKEAAKVELAAGGSLKPDIAISIGDTWWLLAGKQTDEGARNAIMAHAAELYQQGLQSLVGLRKAQIEKRIEQARESAIEQAKAEPPAGSPAAAWKVPGGPNVGVGGGKSINLLPLFDLENGAVKGTWQFTGGALVSDATNNARIQSKYRPPTEYDFLIEFTRPKGTGNIVQLLSAGDRSFEWSIAAAGDTTRLQDVGGHARNGTQRKMPAEIKDAERHTSVVQVRKTGLKMLIDGKEVLNFPTDYSNLSRNGIWKMNDNLCLGVGTWGGPIAFHRIEVIEVSK